MDRRQRNSHQSFGSTEWSHPNSIIHVNVKQRSNKNSLQASTSCMTMLDLKPRQTSRITSISVNRVSRCGLILPNNYSTINGGDDRNRAKYERIITWLNDVNQVYAKDRASLWRET